MKTQECLTTKTCYKCKETLLLTGFYKDRTKKDGHEPRCKTCAKAKASDYRIDNQAKIVTARDKDRERFNAKAKKTYYENHDESKARAVTQSRSYRERNPEKAKESALKWRKANRDKLLVSRLTSEGKRRATKLCCMPKDYDEWYEFSMSEFYSQSVELTRLTGIKHEVDHIIPLNHSKVCGLHVPANMQILTQEQNRKKSNKFG